MKKGAFSLITIKRSGYTTKSKGSVMYTDVELEECMPLFLQKYLVEQMKKILVSVLK